MPAQTTKRQLLAGLTTLIILGGMVGTVSALKHHEEVDHDSPAPVVQSSETGTPPVETSSPTAAEAPTTSPAVTAPQAAAATYKDGTYTATGSYGIPGGETERVGVTLSVRGDAVTDVTITKMARNRESGEYQGYFAEDIKGYVVGKALSSLSVSRVSGSSLTSKGFNSAVAQIRTQAAQ